MALFSWPDNTTQHGPLNSLSTNWQRFFFLGQFVTCQCWTLAGVSISSLGMAIYDGRRGRFTPSRPQTLDPKSPLFSSLFSFFLGNFSSSPSPFPSENGFFVPIIVSPFSC
ncbi:hypothetical protein Dimus_011946 [Dionaea muscipula]